MEIKKFGLPLQNENAQAVSGDRRNPRILEASRLYESQFLREMVRAMRKAVPESDVVPVSQGERIFREQLDDEYVEGWVNNGGVGLADIIYDQVVNRYQALIPQMKPKGPLPLESSELKSPPKKDANGLTFRLQTPQVSPPVLSPWPAKLLSSQDLGHGLSGLLLDHGQGLKSSLVYKGSMLLTDGASLEAGARIGYLSPDNQSVLWRIFDG